MKHKPFALKAKHVSLRPEGETNFRKNVSDFRRCRRHYFATRHRQHRQVVSTSSISIRSCSTTLSKFRRRLNVSVDGARRPFVHLILKEVENTERVGRTGNRLRITFVFQNTKTKRKKTKECRK